MTAGTDARPTVYKGIQMRSRLEAGFAQWLDAAGLKWAYEPQCFASEAGQYLPDFLVKGIIVDGITKDIYFEVKPDIPSGDEARRWVAIMRANGEHLVLVAPTLRGQVVFLEFTSLASWIFSDDTSRVELAFSPTPPWHGEWWKGAM